MRGRTAIVAVVSAAGLLLLAACADRPRGPGPTGAQAQAPVGKGRGIYKVGNPYQINGVWYYPQENPNYDETGIASWYGPGFHGNGTANGEIYDQNELTAAHQTLPMPSFVRVTNLENGRSIVVRVNDRGPFVNGRIIDMTRRGAQLLGFYERGTARVRVQAVPGGGPDGDQPLQPPVDRRDLPIQVAAQPKGSVSTEALPPPPGVKGQSAPLPAPAAPSPPSATAVIAASEAKPIDLEKQPVRQVAVKPTAIYVQAGAFTQFENAHRLSARISSIAPANVTAVTVRGTEFFRVRIGPLESVEAADRTLAQVIATGQPDARIVID
jgi:rare lipoprotein A